MEIVTRALLQKIPEILEEIEQDPGSYLGVGFNLSRLKNPNRNLYLAKAAINVISSKLEAKDGWIIYFTSGDIICIANSIDSKEEVYGIIEDIRGLFINDSLAYIAGTPNPSFASIYKLPINYNSLKTQLHRNAKIGMNSPGRVAKAPAKTPGRFTGQELLQVEEDLDKLSYNNFLDFKSCFLKYKDSFKYLFSEVSIDFNKVKRYLGYSFDFSSNRHFYNYLSSKLQTELLSLIMKNPGEVRGEAFSMNLNLDNLSSETFEEFYRRTNLGLWEKVIIEISVKEVVRDFALYLEISAFLKDLGFLVCINDFDFYSLHFFNINDLRCDFIKFSRGRRFSAEFLKQNQKDLEEVLKHNFGINKVILSEVEDKTELKLGYSLGLQLFQGLQCERMMRGAN
jgi:hypothetical protein